MRGGRSAATSDGCYATLADTDRDPCVWDDTCLGAPCSTPYGYHGSVLRIGGWIWGRRARADSLGLIFIYTTSSYKAYVSPHRHYPLVFFLATVAVFHLL